MHARAEHATMPVHVAACIATVQHECSFDGMGSSHWLAHNCLHELHMHVAWPPGLALACNTLISV